MRKITKILLVVVMLLGVATVNIVADDYDFPNNEDYYYSLCASKGLTTDQKTACKAFQSYLTKIANDVQKLVNQNKKDIESIKKDINKVLAKISELDKEIAKVEKQINSIEKQINRIEKNINELETQIEEREEKIKELDRLIQERMANMQSFVTLNQYVEFVMGSKDFADMIRRTSTINEVMKYDTDQITKLEEEKLLLQVDIDEMEEQKLSLSLQGELLEVSRKSLAAVKKTQNDLVATYLKKKAEIEADLRENIPYLEDLLETINQIAKDLNNVQPSPGWIYPVNGGWSISAGAFSYPKSFGGGLHLGVDFAASSSRKVVAVANGVVAFASDGCDRGYLGSRCGVVAATGNMVLLVVSVGSKTYGVAIFHMLKGVSKYVKKGQIVTQGQMLGYVGSSGNSTGNHAHIEIYDLGTMTLQAALTKFAKSGDVTFGTGWRSTSTSCDKKKTTPCRVNPMSIFNVKVGQRAK